jgi:hypothetical protein
MFVAVSSFSIGAIVRHSQKSRYAAIAHSFVFIGSNYTTSAYLSRQPFATRQQMM